MTVAEIPTMLAWMTITVVAYHAALVLGRWARSHPLVNPVVLTVTLVILVLLVTHTSQSTYAAAVRPIRFMLGPATVALAVPLHRNLAKLEGVGVAAAVSIVSGSCAAAGSAMLIAHLLGASTITVRSLAPKSVTTPVAIAVSESIGGTPSLTAAFVIVTGMVGAVVVPTIFELLRVGDPRARGLATGVAAHGIGTARAIAIGEVEGAFSTLGTGISSTFVPIVLPVVLHWLGFAR